jgi:3-methyladenine DNA glycosylase AlkD
MVHPLVAAIDAEADPDQAAELARFFQVRPGGYGDGDRFAGVRLSRLRELARPYRREGFEPEAWLPLLHSPVHEHRMACLIVMADRADRGDRDERVMITDHYLANTRRVDNWDLVDASAAQILGRRLLDPDGDRTVLDRLAGSAWLWDRRIAMVGTHQLIRAGQTADTYRIAERLLTDRHDLIHKAVGWMLREAGKRVDEAELRAFLDRHAARMPRTALSYAIERLDPESRSRYRAAR